VDARSSGVSWQRKGGSLLCVLAVNGCAKIVIFPTLCIRRNCVRTVAPVYPQPVGGLRAGFIEELSFLEETESVSRMSRLLWQINALTQRKHPGIGGSLLQKQRPPLRESGRSSHYGADALDTRRMQPEDPGKDVSFHQFFYRVNPDKTIDAICGFCYLTAATAENPADLQMRERAHRCPGGRDSRSG